MKNLRIAWLPLSVLTLVAGACGDDDGGSNVQTLDDFLPTLPSVTGEAQSTWAGEITMAHVNELLEGPAASGMAGDFYMRNSKARFVIEAPVRVLGVVPQGGNLVDAVALGSDGEPLSEDHFGELSLIYVIGRTCGHDRVEVLLDGSGGGAAVVRATGKAEANDRLNLRGMGVLNIPLELDPDIDDLVDCATTYVLEPDSPVLHVSFTLFNGSTHDIHGPFGTLADSGGVTEAWGPGVGFERLGLGSLSSLGAANPVPYVLYQGPGVAYGIIPHHDGAVTNATFLVTGVSLLLYGADRLSDILNEDTFYLHLLAGQGITHGADVVVGRDASDVEAHFQARKGNNAARISGTVAWSDGGVPTGARVAFFVDSNSNEIIDDEDKIRGYADSNDAGDFTARLPQGDYLMRAEVKDIGRSATKAITASSDAITGESITIPSPAYFDYTIIDAETDNIIPGKLTVLGRHPISPNNGVFEVYDRRFGVVRMVHSVAGSTVVGENADSPLALPVGGTYRIIASRGTEWSIASVVVNPTIDGAQEALELRLRRVAEPQGYVSSEYHVHLVGSPDSPVSQPDRIASLISEGIEVFAATDHDFVTDLQPLIEQLGVGSMIRSLAGLESSPFAYGHFNSYPLIPDDTSPNKGAIDWAKGPDGFAMIPGEIFEQARDQGATVIQVNHPRSSLGGANFTNYFDRAALGFDYTAHQVTGSFIDAPVPNSWMRLPDVSLWDDTFNVLEVWNGFNMTDSNDDGVREIVSADLPMRDWFNFLSFGMEVTPTGNSDSHTLLESPTGMPRTYVRVVDDSPTALASGNIVEDLLDTLTGRNNTPRDVVITNGPHIEVSLAGDDKSSIGSVLDGSAGSVTIAVSILSPNWAPFDTVEIFINATPEIDAGSTALEPDICFTARATKDLEANDLCALAALGGAQTLTISSIEFAPGFFRYESQLTFTISADALNNRAGAVGGDAWFVVRTRGNQAIVPILIEETITEENIDVLVNGDDAARAAALYNVGVPAQAFTAPVYIDFDGNGYRAIFAP